MAIKPDQLPAQLARSLAPGYLIAGSEPLLVQECRDQIIHAAHVRGFVERSVHEVTARFDWNRLAEDSAAPSLFSSRKVLDIRLPTGKPGNDGSAALVALAEAADPDVLLLVSAGEWSGAMRKLKWVTALTAAGALIEIWPVKPAQLPDWIRQRMRRAGLQPNPRPSRCSPRWSKGTCWRHSRKSTSSCCSPGYRVTVEDVERTVANSARFDAFRLVECLLQGHSTRACGSPGCNAPAWPSRPSPAPSIANVPGGFGAFGDQRGRERGGGVRTCGSGRPPGPHARPCADCRPGISATRSGPGPDRPASKGRAQGDAWQTLDRLLWSLCEPTAAIGPVGRL
jgi:DNA polymerase-3 subunit delta